VQKIEPFEYALNTEPSFQRGFFMIRNKINPYAMSVGIPGGMNYAYDLSTYTILSAWRGKYIDVSNMWTDRGETQREIPLGTPVEFHNKPNMTKLLDSNDDWPDTVSVDNNMYTNRGYRIDEKGLPVFMYTYETAAVEDYIFPSPDKSGFTRSINVQFNGIDDQLYFLIGSGKMIEQLSNGCYAIDEKAYYIESITGLDAKNVKLVKSKNGMQNLLLVLTPANNSNLRFSYSLIW
jgi:hypothetical protein